MVWQQNKSWLAFKQVYKCLIVSPQNKNQRWGESCVWQYSHWTSDKTFWCSHSLRSQTNKALAIQNHWESWQPPGSPIVSLRCEQGIFLSTDWDGSNHLVIRQTKIILCTNLNSPVDAVLLFYLNSKDENLNLFHSGSWNAGIRTWFLTQGVNGGVILQLPRVHLYAEM